jgi:hypothetical protein
MMTKAGAAARISASPAGNRLRVDSSYRGEPHSGALTFSRIFAQHRFVEPAMCDDAKELLRKYLDALEECDRVHLRFLSAYRNGDKVAAESYWDLWNEVRLKMRTARDSFQSHQRSHGCSEALRFDDPS